MKKSLLILFTAGLTLTASIGHTQLVNPGFETWSSDALGATGAMDPNGGNGTTGWWDFNALSGTFTGGSPVSVKQVTDTIHGGTYAARIQTVVYTPTSYGHISAFGFKDTNGIVIYGNLAAGASVTFKPGIPFTQKITQFMFYYQYKPNGVDTAECVVGMYKYVGGVRTLKGGGVFKTNTATGGSGWQQGVVNISYSDTLSPDTMVVELSSSSLYSKPKPGSVLWVDDASVTVPTGINQVVGTENSVEVYPNPASTAVNFRISGMNNAATIAVYDITGKKIGSTPIHNSLTTINTEAYNSGLYFYQLYDNAGSLIKSGKFSVVK